MAWYHRLRNLMGTDRLNREIDRELSFHVRETADALRDQGLTEVEALREAQRRLGNAGVQRERARDADVVMWLDSFVRDVRHALRGLRQSPVFAVVAVLSLALGIGANTAIFTLLDVVVLRPLPVRAPEQLVIFASAESGEPEYLTNPLWEQIRDRQTGMGVAAAFSTTPLNQSAGGDARRVTAAMVSGDFFRLFGVNPALGRLLQSGDDVRGCSPVVVLGYGHWESEYGRDPSVIGRSLMLERTPFEIIGVAPNGFRGAEVGTDPQVYVPLCSEAAMRGAGSMLDARSSWWLRVMGRREAGLTLEQVNARLASIAPAAYAATVPQRGWSVEDQQAYRSRSFFVRPAATGVSSLRERYTGALVMLMAGVGVVLLIACANVANLLLARATAREREFAIRVAIGAGRARLARQLATESVLLASLGALVGLLVARLGAQGLVALIAQDESRVALDLSLSARVLAFTTGVAVLTALLFGLLPAWRAGRADPNVAMSAKARGIAEGQGGFTVGKALVAAQVAFSVVLLVVAGLLVSSLRNLLTLDPGFRAEGVLIASADLRPADFAAEQIHLTRTALLERLRATPGVHAAGSVEMTPIGTSSWNQEIVVDGYMPTTREDAIVWFNAVSPGYFETLGTPLLAGRDFAAADVAGGLPVAIINQSIARTFFGEGSPIGRQFSVPVGDDPGRTYTVIGMVGDAKYRTLREEESGTVYLAAAQVEDPWPFLNFALRTEGDPSALAPAVRTALAAVHPAIVVEFRGLVEQVEQSVHRERVLAMLSALFGGVALALAMLGLYGVMSYAVARRRNEIGVRIALGADRRRVLRMILGDVGRVVALGLLVGTVAALASGRLVATFLFGVQPGEPMVVITAGGLLALVALSAGLIPAWRAARLDPARALRED